MTGSCLVWGAFKKKKELSIFKGTLIGILVSFFILFCVASLLNLAENYWFAVTGKSGDTALEDDSNPLSWLGVKTAHALAAPGVYKATFFGNSTDKLELLPGEEVTYMVRFKNTGTATWSNTGAKFVSVYTYGPKYRKSVFQSSAWRSSIQLVKMKDAVIKPGQVAFFEFKLKAPQTLGSYSEIFRIAAEDVAWMEDGQFTIPINVVASKKTASVATVPATPVSSGVGAIQPTSQPASQVIPFRAALLLKSHDSINAKSGEVVNMRLVFKNDGSATWSMRGLVVPDEFLESDGRSVFYHPTWISGHQPMASGEAVNPGGTAFFDFKIQAPEAAGTYTVKLKLVLNYDKYAIGGDVEIPIYVADDSVTQDMAGRVKNVLNMTEPMIEVGLEYIETTGQAFEFMADRAYRMTDKAGTVLENFSAGEPIRISYNFSSKLFTAQNARINSQYYGELHFVGAEDNTIFTILSMDRRTSDGINDNKFRDGLILRHADTTGRLWLINRLPMEHYLWGIAETSNIAPLDYIKATIVASRTYALYHYLNPYKYNGYFTVKWTTADQLYRGYQSELRRSKTIEAVNATKGQVITYQGDVVITPYFGHSDGRTRTWTEVWGGTDKPWLRSVVTTHDVGLSMFGHGVGMSQNDAYNHIKSDGWDYTKALKYYYTGVEVSKMY